MMPEKQCIKVRDDEIEAIRAWVPLGVTARPIGSLMRPIVEAIARRAGIENFVYPEPATAGSEGQRLDGGSGNDRDDHSVRGAGGGPSRVAEQCRG